MGRLILGGEIVETSCGIAGENINQSVNFGLILILMSVAAQMLSQC
jgi:type 1 fimbria pilin